MPLYEYRCHGCGKTIEVLQKFSDEPLKTHEDCGGELERLISASAFHLKGSGWYVTDYGKSGAAGAAEKKSAESGKKAETASGDGSSASTAPAAASAPAASESKTESKPAATESKPAA